MYVEPMLSNSQNILITFYVFGFIQFFEFDFIYVFGSVKPQNLCLIFWFCATWVFIFIIF